MRQKARHCTPLSHCTSFPGRKHKILRNGQKSHLGAWCHRHTGSVLKARLTGPFVVSACSHTTTGGSVAKLLLQHPDLYTTRCLTRNPSSDKAKALADMGGELVKADLTVPATLPEAFKGVWGVFAVTDFYDTVRRSSFVWPCGARLRILLFFRPSSRIL